MPGRFSVRRRLFARQAGLFVYLLSGNDGEAEVAAGVVRQQDRFTLTILHEAFEIGNAVDGLLVDGHDDQALAEGIGGRAVGIDIGHDHTLGASREMQFVEDVAAERFNVDAADCGAFAVAAIAVVGRTVVVTIFVVGFKSCGTLTESDSHCFRAAVANDADGNGFAGLMRHYGHGGFVGVGNRLAVDGDDGVARFEAGFVARTTLTYAANDGTLAIFKAEHRGRRRC